MEKKKAPVLADFYSKIWLCTPGPPINGKRFMFFNYNQQLSKNPTPFAPRRCYTSLSSRGMPAWRMARYLPRLKKPSNSIQPPRTIGLHMRPSEVYKSVGRTLVQAISFTPHRPPAKGLTQRTAQTLSPAIAEDCPQGKPDSSLLSKSLHSGTQPP